MSEVSHIFDSEQYINITCGDSRRVLKKILNNTFDSVITDPPYGLVSINKRFGKKNSAPAKEGKDGRFRRLSKGFMEQEWDGTGIERDSEFWGEVLRVTKPGGNALVFGGTRTYHRIMSALEDAGWIIQDVIMWLYGQGFHKSYNINKVMIENRERFHDSPEKWEGWGTRLCPSYEPIIWAMKPLDGTYSENADKWGVSGIWIDGTRTRTTEDLRYSGNSYGRIFSNARNIDGSYCRPNNGDKAKSYYFSDKGRWAKNVIFSHLPECRVVGQERAAGHQEDELIDIYECVEDCPVYQLEKQRKGAGRFFYCTKAAKSEKDEGLTEEENIHPTVKPIQLMEYLCKLTMTPTKGIVLDPFMGSGSTGIGCVLTGRSFVGIEAQSKYYEISQKRIQYWIDKVREQEKLQPKLF